MNKLYLSDSDLEYINLLRKKTCKIPLSRLENNERRYFYTHNSNHLDEYSKYYSANQVKVRFPHLDNTNKMIRNELNP